MQLNKIAGRIREANAKFAAGFNNWLFDVGSNLVEARTMLSKNGSHESEFGEWVERECEISKRHTNRIIAAYQTQTLLRPTGLRKLPTSERQYRELAVVPEEELPQVWERIIDSGQPITARVIRETVKEHQKEQDEEDGIIDHEQQQDPEDDVVDDAEELDEDAAVSEEAAELDDDMAIFQSCLVLPEEEDVEDTTPQPVIKDDEGQAFRRELGMRIFDAGIDAVLGDDEDQAVRLEDVVALFDRLPTSQKASALIAMFESMPAETKTVTLPKLCMDV